MRELPRTETAAPFCGVDRAEDPIDEFVGRHQRALWRFAQLLGCRGQVAEQLCQDAFVIAIDREQHERADAAAAAFLRQTLRHLWLKDQRAEQRRQKHHAAAAAIWWQREAELDDGDGWLDALGRCVGELPARSRHVLDRTYRDGATRSELATELELSDHGVRNLLHRLRTVLRDCIRRRRHS
ncbi:MAG: sigma-70 family RNA polymerase sigma factor [bacterium]|nr:sigma-70 family RNA polymerase sigma factor [bacterium]